MTSLNYEKFLIGMKLIYENGRYNSKQRSRLHRLLAIHNIHYVVEQIVREKAKDHEFGGPLHKIGFEEIIKTVHKSKTIPDHDRLLVLNKIRNNAEHLGLIPDQDDVRFYARIAEEFLRWSYREYFQTDFDSIFTEREIIDKSIRNCMLDAKALMEKRDLVSSSKKMHEALGAFKFMMFGFLSDFRVDGQTFERIGLEVDFPNLLADLAFKIILGEDETALRLVMSVGSSYKVEPDHIVRIVSEYPVPSFSDIDEARERYSSILGLILSYQNKIPASVWRQ